MHEFSAFCCLFYRGWGTRPWSTLRFTLTFRKDWTPFCNTHVPVRKWWSILTQRGEPRGGGQAYPDSATGQGMPGSPRFLLDLRNPVSPPLHSVCLPAESRSLSEMTKAKAACENTNGMAAPHVSKNPTTPTNLMELLLQGSTLRHDGNLGF